MSESRNAGGDEKSQAASTGSCVPRGRGRRNRGTPAELHNRRRWRRDDGGTSSGCHAAPAGCSAAEGEAADGRRVLVRDESDGDVQEVRSLLP